MAGIGIGNPALKARSSTAQAEPWIGIVNPALKARNRIAQGEGCEAGWSPGLGWWQRRAL